MQSHALKEEWHCKVHTIITNSSSSGDMRTRIFFFNTRKLPLSSLTPFRRSHTSITRPIKDLDRRRSWNIKYHHFQCGQRHRKCNSNYPSIINWNDQEGENDGWATGGYPNEPAMVDTTKFLTVAGAFSSWQIVVVDLHSCGRHYVVVHGCRGFQGTWCVVNNPEDA